MRPRRWFVTLACLGGLLALSAGAAPPAFAGNDSWDILTYGNGELLEAAFQGIALFASNGLTSAMKLFALVALLSALFASIPFALGGEHAIMAIPRAAIVAGIVAICSSMHTTVVIVDQVAMTMSKPIGGVPLPIAVIGWATSTFGQRIAERVEQAIYPVDFYGKFTESGLGWGPRVVQAALQVTPLDTAVTEDLNAYIRLCVIPDIEHNDVPIDLILKATKLDDMLGNTNPAIPVLLPSQCSTGQTSACTPPPADQRCPQAYYSYLKGRLAAAAQDANFLQALGQKIGKADPSQVDLVLSSIQQTTGDLLGVQIDALEALQLRFAANQFLPAIQLNATLGGQSAQLTAWAITETQAQQTVSWLATGQLLHQILPFFYNTLEFLFYGFLLFGIPLIIVVPRIFLHVIANAVWLQLWPLAYVFANRVLYMQAVKAGLYTNNMNWGLSLASTDPINNAFNYAYAASGWPILIGVLLLGGMIMGGSYMLTHAVQDGPWNIGAGAAAQAAMGSMTFGKMDIMQNNLAPHTTMMGQTASGEPAIVDIAGPTRSPVTTSYQTAGGASLLGSGMQRYENRDHSLSQVDQGGYRLNMGGLVAASASEQVTAQAGQAAGLALDNAVTTSVAQGVTLSNALNDVVGSMRESSKGSRHSEARGSANAISAASANAAATAYQHTVGANEQLSHMLAIAGRWGNNAEFGVSLKPSAGGIGGGGSMGMEVTFSLNAGNEYNGSVALNLNENQARNFMNSYGQTVTNDHTIRNEISRSTSATESDSLSAARSRAQQASSQIFETQKAAVNAGQNYQNAVIASRIFSQNHESEFGQVAYGYLGFATDKFPTLGSLANAGKEGAAHLESFHESLRGLLLNPNRAGDVRAIAAETNQRFGLGLEQNITATREMIAAGVQSPGGTPPALPANPLTRPRNDPDPAPTGTPAGTPGGPPAAAAKSDPGSRRGTGDRHAPAGHPHPGTPGRSQAPAAAPHTSGPGGGPAQPPTPSDPSIPDLHQIGRQPAGSGAGPVAGVTDFKSWMAEKTAVFGGGFGGGYIPNASRVLPGEDQHLGVANAQVRKPEPTGPTVKAAEQTAWAKVGQVRSSEDDTKPTTSSNAADALTNAQGR